MHWKKSLDEENKTEEVADCNVITNEEETAEEISKKVAHYMLNEDQLGYNETDIMFPLPQCPSQKSVIDSKMDGTFTQPEVLKPVYDPNK